MMQSYPPVLSPVLACMDSGVGGLAVLQRVLDVLPSAAYVFVGDTAWMPYGEKPLDVVKDRVLSLHQWLHQTHNLNAFILACNTGTAAAFDTLSETDWGYPLLEPVSTTARWVNAHIAPERKIGILATPGTVSSGRYLGLLDAQRPVCQVAGVGLATLIESGCTSGPQLEAALVPFLEPLQAFGAEVVILGCTHYSLVQPVVQKMLGKTVQLVDSATILAEVAIPVLTQLGLASGDQTLCVTGDSKAFESVVRSLPLPAFSTTPVHAMTLEAQNKPLTTVTPSPA